MNRPRLARLLAAASLALGLAAPTLPVLAQAAPSIPPQYTATAVALNKNSGDKIRVDAISVTPIPGLLEARAGLDVFFTDPSGRYVIVEGRMLDLTTGRDLTQDSIERAASIDFKSLPLDLAFKTVRGNGKRKIAVFEDPACSICRSIKKFTAQLDDVTIYTFPFPVLSADGDRAARAAVCSADPARAWEQLMSGQAPNVAAGRPSANCSSRIDRVIDLGQRLNVVGTPTFFFGDGRRVQGAVPPDQFIAALDDSAKSDAPSARR